VRDVPGEVVTNGRDVGQLDGDVRTAAAQVVTLAAGVAA